MARIVGQRAGPLGSGCETGPVGDVTVVIVGAGPAGLVLGHLLQRAGVPFVIVERRRRADVGGPPKAGMVEHRTVELLRAEGIGDVDVHFTVENGLVEFRTPGSSMLLDYGARTGDRPHYVYPQHVLVEDLCAALLARGADIRFGCRVRSVDSLGVSAAVHYDDEHDIARRLDADVVVGCDGARSMVVGALTDARTTEVELPVRWLAMIAAAAPLVPHSVYSAHPHGFAGQMRRGPEQTRYYLEVPRVDTIADWPPGRARAELEERLGVPGRLADVRLGDMTLVDLRVGVTEPMQQGPLFVAGDAAHLVTPAGGKGMNLAIRDAVELAHGIIERVGGHGARLAAYSTTRLADIWRTQAFSYWFLGILIANRDAASFAASPGLPLFAARTRDGWVSALQHDPLLATWFAHAYAGADPVEAPDRRG